MFEVIELNESKKKMKSINVIIYGTIRDIEQHFVKSFINIDLLCQFFNKVYIIIFENDSVDNTRNLLTNWASFNNNVNVIKHLILENNLNSLFPLRATRLAYCRNKILNYIFDNNLDNTYQYAIHCDLDDRFWSLDYDSICNCFQYDLNAWDAMFPINSNYSYYDFWALRCNETWFNRNIFCCEIENNDDFMEYENHVSDFSSFLVNNKNCLISVDSAFNGIGIYKLNSLKNCKYDASYYCNKCKGEKKGCLEDNDHIGLHKKMILNNSKLFINTKMVLHDDKKYVSYRNFIKNLQNIPNIKKDPLKYVFYKKIVDKNDLWLNFSNKLGNYENIISNFTTNNIFTFCKNANDSYSNDLINNNVIKYVENIKKSVNKFILDNYNTLISFIHIDFNNYHNTKFIFDKLYKNINNGCIIVINKFINHNDYLLNDLHAFYEFTQKYNIKFEYIGINGDFFINPNNHTNYNTNVAIKIIKNSNIEITNDFDWKKYIETYNDLKHVKTEEEAWDHWINYGKNEGRQYFSMKIQLDTTQDEYNDFDWKKYIELYNDLKHISTKDQAWHHWINCGKNEDRQYCTEKIERKIDIIQNEIDIIQNKIDIFDWKKYISKNVDLKHIQNKEDAWSHWKKYGKDEGRKFYIKPKYSATIFDWKSYIENNNDLSHIKTEEEAWDHWNNYGKNEGRDFSNKDFIKFNNFDWRYYIENNKDLKEIETKEQAWDHWEKYGKYENRLFKKKLKKVELLF